MVVWCTSPLPIAKTSKMSHYLTYYFCPLLFYFYVLKGNHWQGRQRWCLYRRVEAIESTWENNANCGVLTPAAVPLKRTARWQSIGHIVLSPVRFFGRTPSTTLMLNRTPRWYLSLKPNRYIKYVPHPVRDVVNPVRLFFFFFSFVDDVSFLSPMACVLLLKKTLDV